MREERKFYALLNFLGDFGNPIQIITNSKEKMVNALNDVYRLVTREDYSPYDLGDLDEAGRIIRANPSMYYPDDKDTILSHYISDDFTEVTDDESVHIAAKMRAENHTGKKVKNFPVK